MSVIGIVGVVIAVGAAIFLGGEEHQPGRFFIERQAYWNGDGKYYMKFTFLSVLLTLCDVFVLPMIVFSGLAALMKSRESDPTPPLDWDTSQLGRRFKSLAVVLVATPLWLGYTGAAIIAPELLKPVGVLASVLLILVPIVPMVVAGLTFEALVAPRYLEGPLESLQIVTNKNTSVAHLRVAGNDFQTQPTVVNGLSQGMKVGLIVSGFFKAIIRLERRG
jgi:hypothetical protein